MILKDKTYSILISLFLGLILIKSLLLYFFQSPWIFSDEQSYFGMAEKVIQGDFKKITNSHQPGYSLVVALAMLMPTISLSYKMILFINTIISSSVIFLAYTLFRNIFKENRKKSIFLSLLVSLLPQFLLYNYVIMSETLNTVVVYGIFSLLLLLSKVEFKHRAGLWALLGIAVGFSPIIRSQNILLFILFLAFALFNIFMADRKIGPAVKNYIISILLAVTTYVIFKYIVFPNTGSYSTQKSDYLLSIVHSFSSASSFIDLSHIFLSEISYFFVATLFIPTFLAIVYLMQKEEMQNYKNVIGFFLVFLSANVAVTTLHANSVLYNLDIKTTYSRYLDFITPIFFTFGLIGINNFSSLARNSNKNIYYIGGIILVTTTLLFIVENNIFPNTFAIYVYQYLGEWTSKILLLVLISIFTIALSRNKTKWVMVGISACLLLTTAPTISRQIKFSTDTFNLYAPMGYWFDKNKIRDATIIIDEELLDNNNQSKDSPYSKSSRMDYTTFYSLLFWTSFYNDIHSAAPDLDENQYIVTDTLLPRSALAFSGNFVLYDKHPQLSFRLSPHMLYRFGRGLNLPEQDWIWMNGNGKYSIDKIPIYDIHELSIVIQLKGFYPRDLDKEVEVFVNERSIGTLKNRDNEFNFSLQSDERFSVDSITILSKTWDPETQKYAAAGKGLGLDLKSINLIYVDQLEEI